MGWIKTTIENMPEYKEILGYDESWIDPDYNPDGIRICIIMDDMMKNEYFCQSAKIGGKYASYIVDEGPIPSHWCDIPKFVKP